MATSNTGHRACHYCSKLFAKRGVKNHERTCNELLRRQQQDADFEAQLLHILVAEIPSGSRNSYSEINDEVDDDILAHTPEEYSLDTYFNNDNEASESSDHSEEGPHPSRLTDDIETIYHPYSGLSPCIESLEEFNLRVTASNDGDINISVIDPQPWRPFRSLLEFELCEFVLDASLTNGLTATLLNILERSSMDSEKTPTNDSDKESLAHLRHPKDISKLWDQASFHRTPFNKSTFTVNLKGTPHYFDVYHLSLWQWALDLIQDPILAPHFNWDAVRLSKWNGKEFVRFRHEPWTADQFWNLQDTLPTGGKPLAYIMYADKTRLSSFGTAQGYPVVVRCANLPVDIRNGNGVGGGRVVGWLPIVHELPEHRRKPYFADFKREVWHAAFNHILQPVYQPSKLGEWVQVPGRSEPIHVFPVLLILSADYEEQSIMALIRGSQGKKPCTTCLVPLDEQNKLDVEYERRSRNQVRAVLQSVTTMRTKGEQNKFLSERGLRGIENVFFNWERADPYLALSYDRLHVCHDGLFGKHLRPEVISRMDNFDRKLREQADEQIRSFPRWRNFYHFQSGFMTITFTDGAKYEDLSKQILFVVHNIITKQTDQLGYLLLKCIRSYLELDMYSDLHVHTTETLQAIEAQAQKFGNLIQEYEKVTQRVDPDAKSWNFPKVHSLKHMARDIVEKGATRNYNTKPNEKMHGSLKDTYQLCTNFKGVAEQILRVDQWYNATSFIRQQINLRDEQLQFVEDSKIGNDEEDGDEDEDNEDNGDSTAREREVHVDYSTKASLHGGRGKAGGLWKLGDLESRKNQDPAFTDLCQRLSAYILKVFEDHPEVIPMRNNKKVVFNGFQPYDKIQLYGLLKTYYRSTVDWKATADYLRCSPDFYNHPRYDCVLIDTVEGFYFAQLVLLFECTIEDKAFPIALVHPFDEPVSRGGGRGTLDADLGFYRVRAAKRHSSTFVSTYSIVRGALLVEDFGYKTNNGPDARKEYLIVDVIDADMFLRMKTLSYIGQRNNQRQPQQRRQE